MGDEAVPLRRSLWISSLITVAGLVVFIVIAALIPRPASDGGLLLLGGFLALVPAVIWLVFFTQQDRAEPEPQRLVIRMFIFGALAAGAFALVSSRMTENINQISATLPRLLMMVVSLSLLQETLKVAMVRYVLLGTEEFDQYPDGIVYGLASGMGFATVLTMIFIFQSDGVLPLAGAIRGVDNALVHGALGAVSGYYLGRVKLDGKGLGWMLQGLLIVSIVNGLYRLLGELLAGQFGFTPLYGLIAAVIVAVVVGAVLFAFFKRAMLRVSGDLSTISITSHARSMEMPWDIHHRYDYLLIITLLVSLIAGFGLSGLLSNPTVNYAGDDLPLDFVYPAGWAVQMEGGGEFALRNLGSEGFYKSEISIDSTKTNSNSLSLLLADHSANYAQYLPIYAESARREGLIIAGYESAQIDYAYAISTRSGPSVVKGTVTYMLVDGRLYIFRYEASPEDFDDNLDSYQRLLNSISFAAGG